MMASNGPGLARTYFVYPSTHLVKLPGGVSHFIASLLEPSSIALRAILSVNVKPQDQVAVIGSGAIGFLIAVHLAYFSGIPKNHLHLFGRQPGKLALTNDFVTTHIIGDNSKSQYGKYDFVFEAVGAEKSVQLALKLTAKTGTCIVVGIKDGPVSLSAEHDGLMIPDLTKFVNSGGSLSLGSKRVKSSAFSLPGDYFTVAGAISNPGYRDKLERMINPDRTFPVNSATELTEAFLFNERHPHFQRTFVVFGDQ